MNHRKMPPRMLDFVCSRRQWIVALLQQVLLELLELFELLELLELLDLLKLLELSKLLELLKLPKLVLQLLRHTPARASASEQRLLSSRCSLTSSWNHANEACNDPYAELANGAARSTRA